MSWLGDYGNRLFKHPFDSRTVLMTLDPVAYRLSQNPKTPARPAPVVPAVTNAEVVASDLRLRRRLNSQKGRASTVVTGGLGDTGSRLTLPTLVGT